MVYVVLIILGLCFGSFSEALTWRIHEQAKPKKRRIATDKDLSMLTGRSMCAHCQHTLAWYDLLPLVSWLSLGGKCRYCHTPIGWQAPALELLTAGLFVLSYLYWPLNFQTTGSIVLFGLWLGFLVGLVALTAYDLRWMLLPDRIVRPLQLLAVVYVLVAFAASKGNWQVIVSSLWGLLCTSGLFYALYQVSKGKWIGGGDVKLAVVLGLLLGGPAKALLMLFIASLIGTAIAIPLMLAGRAKQTSKLPFGPMLIAATIVVYLFGASLIVWYKRQFLIV